MKIDPKKKKLYESMLNCMYWQLNRDHFNNTLPRLSVYVVSGKAFLASCYVNVTDKKPSYMAVCLDNAGEREGDWIRGAILHEMVHAYCILHDIPHFDPKTHKHLQGYIKAAKDHGLIYDEKTNTNKILGFDEWEGAQDEARRKY